MLCVIFKSIQNFVDLFSYLASLSFYIMIVDVRHPFVNTYKISNKLERILLFISDRRQICTGRFIISFTIFFLLNPCRAIHILIGSESIKLYIFLKPKGKIVSTSRLWNNLPAHVFPQNYNIQIKYSRFYQRPYYTNIKYWPSACLLLPCLKCFQIVCYMCHVN